MRWETGVLIILIIIWIVVTLSSLGVTYLTYLPENVGNYFAIDVKSEDGTYKKSKADWRPYLLFADIIIVMNAFIIPVSLIWAYNTHKKYAPQKLN